MNRVPDDLENLMVIPYLTGVYLAVNAIPDAWLVVDGPNCVFFRTAQVHGNHDWHSTLLNCTGLHRIADTDCTTERAAQGDSRLLISRLLEVNRLDACRLILLTAMSPVALTGRQYCKVVADLGMQITKPVVHIEPGSLKGDWLHGYSNTLAALAEQLKLPRRSGALRPDEVSIVGYLMDRNEGDHRANLDELVRLLRGLGLRVSSCWLDGNDLGGLRKIIRSGTILSLPYGRAAARRLASRTGAKLLECALPIGLEGTCTWLRQIGKGLGRQDRVEDLIRRELSTVIPKLEWILPHALLHKSLVLLGNDPFLQSGMVAFARELGCRVALNACWTHRQHLAGLDGDSQILKVNLVDRECRELLGQAETSRLAGVDLVITNSRCLPLLDDRGIPTLELGFPSFHTHYLVDGPFLGFRGALHLVQRMINHLFQSAAVKSSHPRI